MLESLPSELRAAYEAREKRRFPGAGDHDSSADAPESAAPEPAAHDDVAAPDAADADAAVATPEQSLRRVNQLMMALPSAPSLAQFLGQVVEHVIAVTQADLGCVLSLSGRNLAVMATRKRGGGRAPNPSKLLCLSLINRCLRKQQPIIISDVMSDPTAQRVFASADVDGRTLTILPFLEPDGKKGALYLLNGAVPDSEANTQLLLLQPFVNLFPMAYLQFQSSRSFAL